MTTVKKATTKKTTTKTSAAKTVKTSAKKRESTIALKKRIAELEGLVKASGEEQGKMLEAITNLRLKQDAMLGQILKGLFIVGIDPDVIARKCSQMFRKKIVAD